MEITETTILEKAGIAIVATLVAVLSWVGKRNITRIDNCFTQMEQIQKDKIGRLEFDAALTRLTREVDRTIDQVKLSTQRIEDKSERVHERIDEMHNTLVRQALVNTCGPVPRGGSD